MANRTVRIDWNGDTIDLRARGGAAHGTQAGAKHVQDVVGAPCAAAHRPLPRQRPHDPDTGQAAVTFDADYAVYQHEDLDYHHDVGGPKFLESALVSERGAVARIMQAEIRKALGT